MSRVPGRALAVTVWVAVVAAGALLVWLVISRAGAGLVADAGPVTAPSATPVAGDGSPASPGAVRRGSWQGESGVVTASCSSGAVALVGAQPEDGATVRVTDRGPEQLVVTFEGGDEGPVTVVATCRDGRPRFSATSGAGPSDTTSEGDGGDDPGDTSGDTSGDD
jgi:hypothetical protein